MIVLKASDSRNTTISSTTVNDDGETKRIVSTNIGDCLGDCLLSLIICSSIGTQEKTIKLCGMNYYAPQYYTGDSIVVLYIELKKKGWNIVMDGTNSFLLKCPDFDNFGINAMALNENLSLGVPTAMYAHPIDSGIIKVLDMPGVKTTFASVIDMMTDLNYSQVIASGIPVNSTSFPEINEIVEQCVAVLGIKRPYVVVSSAISLNAYTVGSDEEPVIVLGNMLVRVMDKAKLTFIIGHECGHIAMGHVIYHTVVNTASSFANAIPLLGPIVYNTSSFALNAWSRRSEITADRAGLLCCLSLEDAKKALLQLQSGFINANHLDINNYIQNSKRYRRRSILRRVNEFVQSHPPLSKRMEALELFADSELYYEAQGKPVPAGCVGKAQLTNSVEHIIAVLGEE